MIDTNIDMIVVIQRFEDNQEILCNRIFTFILDSLEEYLIQEKYLDFADVLSKHNTKTFSQYFNVNLAIELEPEITPFISLIYNLSRLGPKTLQL